MFVEIKLLCVSLDLVEFGDSRRQCLIWVPFQVKLRLFAKHLIVKLSHIRH